MRSGLYLILIPALLPVALVFYYVYKKDKVEREPLNFVLKVLGLGAVFSIPCAGVESFLANIISASFVPGTVLYAFVDNTLGVALVEEFSKWLVLMIFVWGNSNFDYRYDGIVYAVAASLGFAALENILYIVTYGTGVSIGRAIFSIPGHATFGVFMGFFLSRAKTALIDSNHSLKIGFKLLSLFVPVVIHGLYDFLLSDPISSSPYSSLFYVFVILLDVVAWRCINHEFSTDRIL